MAHIKSKVRGNKRSKTGSSLKNLASVKNIEKQRGSIEPNPLTETHADTAYNHLECNYHLCNKKALFYNMKALAEFKGEDPFQDIPLTFHVKDNLTDPEYTKFESYYTDLQSEIDEETKKKSNKYNTWIVKPGENTNRGNGIIYCRDIASVKEIVEKVKLLPNGNKRSYIIQKYLDRPFLYNRRKFDIRCFVVVTHAGGNLMAYWCKDGYIRTASKEFSLKNMSRYVHLTNDAV